MGRVTSPFIGVVLAGVFTSGALSQLKSNGFTVLHFTYDTVIAAFKKYNIDASFDEKTAETEFRKKIDDWNKLQNKQDIADELIRLNSNEVDDFFRALTNSVSRYIECIIISPLHANRYEANNISKAIDIIQLYPESQSNLPLSKYEILIRYNTGDKIEASFKDKHDCIKFLENYQ